MYIIKRRDGLLAFLPEGVIRSGWPGRAGGKDEQRKALKEAWMDRHFLHRQRHQEQPGEGERARVLAELASGRPLGDVLDGEAAVVGAMPVRPLLEALPWVDRIHAGQLMHALHIGERCTVGELADLQRQRLRQLFPPATVV